MIQPRSLRQKIGTTGNVVVETVSVAIGFANEAEMGSVNQIDVQGIMIADTILGHLNA